MASEYRAEVQQMIDACGAPAVGLIELGVKLGLEAAAAALRASMVGPGAYDIDSEDLLSLSPTDILKAKGGKP